MRIENSFIPVRGVGETTERSLWANGVTHWEDFSGDHVGPKTAERIETYIETATKHLENESFEFFAESVPSRHQWRLFENAGVNTCYLDIETTGLDRDRHDVTTVSFYHDGSTDTLVRGQDLSGETLRQALSEASLLVTFNGRRFDVPFLEANFDVDVSIPHLDLYYPCRSLDLTGGLKRIEREIGIARDEPDISGRDAVRLWHQYERGDEHALDTLIRYNQADTENLAQLTTHVTSRLHETVFESACNGDE
ncbi:ribonuclease H-like domain-containing protein [Halovivax gelatinilyticus]|uniref:ribonuclease H-like domain-containing protein n=1 Tax=Halovivax gelatinilyticus TaxID=2961597 RepID=UPI0020CA4BC0|nr:ribonuclease H-like domain-containing protein [Halovivax gelatinilyticus]